MTVAETSSIQVAENIADISFTSLIKDDSSLCVIPMTSNSADTIEAEPDFKEDTLRNYLASINEGKALLRQFEACGLLENSARKKLCNILINRELQANPDAKITSQHFYQLAFNITTVFKKESVPVYFTPFTNKAPSKGKLVDSFRFRRRQFLKSGLITTRKRKASTSSSCSSRPSSPSSYHDSTVETTDGTEVVDGDLRNYLASINEGKALLVQFESCGLLDYSARRKLCNIIINRELQANPDAKITSQHFYQLAFNITTVFKKESVPVYFRPYASVNSAHKTASKGKLVDTYRQRRREFLKSGLIARRHASPYLDAASRVEKATKNLPDLTIEASEAADDNLKWLKKSCDPWATVKLYWEQTRKLRFQKIAETKMSLTDCLNEFRALRQPAGLHLLLSDFNSLYPEHNDKLIENWPLYRDRVLDAARKRRDPMLREMLSCFSDDDVNNDAIDTAAFMSLFFLISTTVIRNAGKKTQWRPSKLEALQGFITHIKSSAELETSITHRKEKITGKGCSLQPYIIIIGTSLKEIHTRYIVINNVKCSSTSDIRYSSNSIVNAVDACFKIQFALNAEYSADCSNVWHFIQKGMYKLTTQFDKEYTSVNCLMSDLGIA